MTIASRGLGYLPKAEALYAGETGEGGEKPPIAGAEGATAPETLRQKDHGRPTGTLESSNRHRGLAEGITISGEKDRGGSKQARNRALIRAGV